MERSDEVRDVLSSLIKTFGTEQMGPAFTDRISSEPGTLVIGTDAREWWDTPDSLFRALKAQGEELQGATATVSHAEGWVEGDVGWGAVKVDVAFPGAPTASMRFTATLAPRSGGWKIVQGHASVGAPNEEVVGKDLTV
jgi:hypothetical protein